MVSSDEVSQQLTPPIGERDHIQGLADAPVTLVEYADFECPFCGDAFAIVREAQRRLSDRLRFVYRHFPVPSVHPHAQRAAEATEAAAAQGSFWAMHDYLFTHQPSLAEPDLIRYAGLLGLDVDRFARDLRDGSFAARVREDLASGRQSGVSSTPTFFINGRRHDGSWDLKPLLAALETAAG
jgi:protein-disulfide isomerase